ncbi:nucleoside 2-deoxyribosyltransferase [Fibrisoma montanum]|nr:nucleoside 2-deoxyribosyltransferase [Fibrisoma montanum]
MKENICLVGEIIVDLTLKPEKKLRLGGILHAARALWAVDAQYDLLYFAPAYLHNQIKKFASLHGASNVICIGEVEGAPNIILIEEAKEVGNQGYELILEDEYDVRYNLFELKKYLQRGLCSDIVIFSGQFNFEKIVKELEGYDARFHADIANAFKNISPLKKCNVRFETLFISTSSNLFLSFFNSDVEALNNYLLSNHCNNLLFKQNRGGAVLFEGDGQENFIGAQIRKISHSVGVGDCFDVIYVNAKRNLNSTEALSYASWIAADYATTSFPDDFKALTKKTLLLDKNFILENKGIYLPWSLRTSINIYIAGADFDFKDTAFINALYECLKYHNFSPRRPVQENGQMEADASLSRRQELYENDLKILKECQIVIAVLTDNDPGTLVEIGIASAWQIPILLFDPYNMAKNCMLTQSCNFITNSMDDLIDEVFRLSIRL